MPNSNYIAADSLQLVEPRTIGCCKKLIDSSELEGLPADFLY